MPRKPRTLDRDDGVEKDADLVIIASEDRYAVEDYFRRFKTRQVQFRVLPTLDCRSAPAHVMQRLIDFKQTNETEEGDSLWLCIDRDQWDEHGLREVISECGRQGFRIAMCNPCFDLWVLLHFFDAPTGDVTADDLKSQLKGFLGGYSKKCCRSVKITTETVEDAVRRAKAIDNGEHDMALSGSMLARVYRILDQLIELDRIELRDVGC